MRSFLAAISMLSILPVGKFVPSENDLRKMVNYYPWAGMFFALLFFGIAYLIQDLPQLIGAMLLTILPEVLTRGFHLDGLADTADGFLSGRPRERKLEIMRDSRIGTMGVLAIFAVLGLKFACFASLPQHLLPAAAAISILSGRCGIVWYIAMSRYARAEGLGKLSFSQNASAGSVSGFFLLGLSGFFLIGEFAALLPVLLLLFMFLWKKITQKVIGGATGDTIGCAEEMAETLILLSCCNV